MRNGKRVLAMLLVFVLCLAAGNPALAAEELQRVELKTKTTAELMACIPQARTQAEADAVFEELMARKAAGEPLRGMIDSYVTANSTTMTSSEVTVNYTVKAILPSGASLRVGYEYPAVTRTAGTFANIQNTVGTHTKSFSGPFLSCQMRARFTFSANSYSENKVLKTYMNVRGGSGGRVITAGDVAAGTYAFTIAGILITMAFPGAGTIMQLVTPTAVSINNVAYSAGQYIHTSTSVSGNKITLTVRQYASQEAYTSGAAPMSTRSGTATIPSF